MLVRNLRACNLQTLNNIYAFHLLCVELFWWGISHINSFWLSDTIWRQRSGSTLAQVIPRCLTAPSHYLNQCWLVISEVQLDIHIGAISQEMPQPSITKICLKITYLKFHSNFPGANKIKSIFSITFLDTNDQSGTKPNLVAKIWPPNLVTICAWQCAK